MTRSGVTLMTFTPISFEKGRGSSCMGLPRICCHHRPGRGTRSMTREVKRERVGVLVAVLSSTFGGTAAAVTRYAIGTVDPVTLAAFRFGIGFIVLLPLALLWRSTFPRGHDRIGASLLGIMF